MAADQLEMRPIEAGEVTAYIKAVEAAFGGVPTEEEIEFWTSLTEIDKTLAVFDRGRMVATAAWNDYEFTLPAGPGSPNPLITVPGVTAVGVHPTHRRRGLLTRMMNRQLEDLRRRGDPLAILTASEGSIYGRFGYGLATLRQEVAVDTRRAAFARPVASGGRMRLSDPDEASKILPDLHARARRFRPGEIGRLPTWWDWEFRDPEKERDGGNARFYAVHESDRGEPDGYASYRYHWSSTDGRPTGKAAIGDIVALRGEVRAALWRFVLDLDLIAEVTCRLSPMDEPLRWLLADPRQMRASGVRDFIWARIIDIPRALAARGYGCDARLVIEVIADDPDSAGRWVVETGAAGATCRKARKADKTDLMLGLADLGAIYLGGVAPSALAAAGRVDEQRPGALARADVAFGSQVAPFCSTGF